MDEEKHACKRYSKSMDESDQLNYPISGRVNAKNVLPKGED